jgi:hypothetical protein
MRLQCDAARFPFDSFWEPGYRARERELLRQYEETWLRDLPRQDGVEYEFWLGMPRAVVADLGVLGRVGPALLEAGVTALRLQSLRRIEQLDRCELLSGFRALSLTKTRLARGACEALARCPFLDNITVLDLSYTRLDSAGMNALASSAHFGKLKTLDLSGNKLGGAFGAVALCLRSCFREVTSLNLSYNKAEEWDVIHLVYRKTLDGVRVLRLRGCQLTDYVLERMTFATDAGSSSLTTLDLSINRLTSDGALSILDSLFLAGLKDLNIARNNVGLSADGKLRERFEVEEG